MPRRPWFEIPYRPSRSRVLIAPRGGHAATPRGTPRRRRATSTTKNSAMPSRPCATTRRRAAPDWAALEKAAQTVVEASVESAAVVREGHGPRGRQDARAARDLEQARRLHRGAEDALRSRAEVVSGREGQGCRRRAGRVQGSRRRLQELPRQLSARPKINRSMTDEAGAVPDPRAGLGRADAPVPLADGGAGSPSPGGPARAAASSGIAGAATRCSALVDLPHLLGLLRQFHRALRAVRARTARHRRVTCAARGAAMPGHNPLGALSVIALLALLPRRSCSGCLPWTSTASSPDRCRCT